MRSCGYARLLLLATLSVAFHVRPTWAADDSASGAPVESDVSASLQAAVQQLSGTISVAGKPLLPPGTQVDSATMTPAHTAVVLLTIPEGAALASLSEREASDIDTALGAAIAAGRELAGLSIQLRSPGGAYQSLASFVGGPAPLPSDEPVVEPDAAAGDVAPMALGGPVANAGGQPVGALSNVVVFCSAGHGWTNFPAVSGLPNRWSLQRGIGNSMNEDYGNLDQLNYFVQYLYNAGATVVPFRPVGYQPIEIVIDNDDAGASYTGTWNNATGASGDSSKYYQGALTSSVRYRYAAAAASQTATARYTPNITQAGFYPVYCWTAIPEGAGSVSRVRQTYRVVHTGGTAPITIDHRIVGRGWIWLGNFYFNAGTGGYVEVSNQSADSGYVIADAIRFGNGIGDVPGTHTNTISGYIREEECSRYWAHSELGIEARGFSSSIWSCCTDDDDDNVGTAARWSREMNMTDVNSQRWRRIYIEFHTNAAGGTAKGTVALYNDADTRTTNQIAYATLLGEKIEADMLALDNGFEYDWGPRNPNTYQASFNYGAISTVANSNEFDATILEVAFHDNVEDAANLRNAKVRDAVARSTLQGIVTFLSNGTTFSGTQVPAVFLPDPPQNVRAKHDGSGNIIVSWQPGPSLPGNPASGHAATGYRIYRSTNGYGFGEAVTLGNILTTTISNIPSDSTLYIRVAATNAGGESMPSETLAVRRPSAGPGQVLIVNGYDRVSRHLNPTQQISLGTMERQIPRGVNSFDYIVQHAEAIAASGTTFDSCSNEAVLAGTVSLGSYPTVVWILGRESTDDRTFDSSEQALVSSYLATGGSLFLSGTDIGWNLDSQNNGRTFYEDTLRTNWVGDNAGSTSAIGVGGIMDGLASFSFDTTAGAPYKATAPDRIAPQSGAVTILNYVGGTADGAAIQYDSGVYRLVMFGFPFETIGSPSVRNDVMGRILGFLSPSGNCHVARISGFDGYANGTTVLFREPRYSGSTQAHLQLAPNAAGVSTDVTPFDGTAEYKVQWQWVDPNPGRWLRLTTFDAPGVPNPAIDLRRAVRVRLRVDSGSFLLSLGVRETGAEVGIGENGGTTGTIEWMGASFVVEGAPQGIRIDAQPGVWQTVTFVASPQATQAFTGDGVLYTPNDIGVLEHLALAPVDTAGPFTVYLDAIEQPCPPRVDFDADGDVDQEDFAHLQACMSGSFVPQTDTACLDALIDGDSDVDDADFTRFQNCMKGANVAVDPSCAD